MNDWKSSISIFSNIARSQPHAAFTALTHVLLSKWTHFSRVRPNISRFFVPLDNSLRTDQLPALMGCSPPSDLECALFDIPSRFGGLGIYAYHHICGSIWGWYTYSTKTGFSGFNGFDTSYFHYLNTSYFTYQTTYIPLLHSQNHATFHYFTLTQEEN